VQWAWARVALGAARATAAAPAAVKRRPSSPGSTPPGAAWCSRTSPDPETATWPTPAAPSRPATSPATRLVPTTVTAAARRPARTSSALSPCWTRSAARSAARRGTLVAVSCRVGRARKPAVVSASRAEPGMAASSPCRAIRRRTASWSMPSTITRRVPSSSWICPVARHSSRADGLSTAGGGWTCGSGLWITRRLGPERWVGRASAHDDRRRGRPFEVVHTSTVSLYCISTPVDNAVDCLRNMWIAGSGLWTLANPLSMTQNPSAWAATVSATGDHRTVAWAPKSGSPQRRALVRRGGRHSDGLGWRRAPRGRGAA
jgi:hypothetical protein